LEATCVGLGEGNGSDGEGLRARGSGARRPSRHHMASAQTLSLCTVDHARQAATLIGAMLEKMAMAGSDRRRNEWPPALTQGHMLSLISAANPVRALRPHTLPSSRDFLARFLFDTQCPSRCRSTRHSDTSRNGSNFFHPIKTASATRHLNATLVTRHSSPKIEPVLPSLFFLSDMPNVGSACQATHTTPLRDDGCSSKGKREGSRRVCG
jgi:hypothetical protein